MDYVAYQSTDSMTNLQSIEQELLITLYGLDNLRRTLPPDEWKHFCKTQATHRPLHKLLLHDPYTRRAFEKPRGYAGDAVMLDFLYKYNLLIDTIENPIGKSIFYFTTHSDPGEAVRHRRKYIAQLLDDIAKKSSTPISVLSLAAGHVREAELSKAIQSKKITKLVAYDQDEESLEVVRNQYGCFNIIPVQGKIKALFQPQFSLGKFDFIYASGLFDYLDQYAGTQLVQRMFDALNEGGYILVSNFREDVPNTLYRTYMEAFMHWFLVYRTDVEIIDLFSGINPKRIEEFSYSADPLCNIAYALLKKRK